MMARQLRSYDNINLVLKYQMQKSGKKIIDSVSACELLKALSTLQHIGEGEQGEISFSQDSKVRAEGKPGNARLINFDQYMARKDQGKQKQPRNVQRKSISPLHQHNTPHTLKIADIKSRSHSPLTKKPEKTDRSMLITHKKPKPQPPQVQPVRNPRDNKENKREEATAKSDKLYRASFQSKRILDEKEKKGAAYVPIQLRTEELLKEKQAKLARLQKEQEMNNILRQKECTFKPNIIKTYKRKPRQEKAEHEKTDKLDKIEEESMRFDDGMQENQFLCTPTQPVANAEIQFEPSQYLSPLQQDPPKQPQRKYKNDKFNMLLDLIH